MGTGRNATASAGGLGGDIEDLVDAWRKEIVVILIVQAMNCRYQTYCDVAQRACRVANVATPQLSGHYFPTHPNIYRSFGGFK